jgi:hypothetical protein
MKKPAVITNSREYVVSRIVLLLVALALCAGSLKPFIKLMLKTLKNSKTYLSEPLEKIKMDEYGDCNMLGYGYIKKITPSIPDPNLFPVIRYSTYNLFPHVLFSDSRYRSDDKILIGIDLDPDATRETIISQAVLNSVETNPARSRWVFQTGLDYDLLTGFIFHVPNDLPTPAQNMIVTLYDSTVNFVELGHWAVKVPVTSSGSFTYKFEKPIDHFSFSRGATDFILVIESLDTTSEIQIDKIETLGVKVDISNYTIFNKDFDHQERCFAAIKSSFLQEIYDNNYTGWKKYLDEVSNVEPIK